MYDLTVFLFRSFVTLTIHHGDLDSSSSFDCADAQDQGGKGLGSEQKSVSNLQP